MVMKGDSSLLVNRKPFFIPDWSSDVQMTPCVVLRVSRLGKNIATRFASRYYDAFAYGLNICARDYLAQGEMVQAWAFDYSLVVGSFVPQEQWENIPTLLPYDEAIHRVSQIMTIRQGDFIYIDMPTASRALMPEEVIRIAKDNNELLYCKIK